MKNVTVPPESCKCGKTWGLFVLELDLCDACRLFLDRKWEWWLYNDGHEEDEDE